MPEIFSADKDQKKATSPSRSKKKPTAVARKTQPKKKNKPGKTKKNHRRTVDEYSETIKREPSAKNPLTAFAAKPYKVGFDSQMKDEEVVLMLRRHPVTQLKKIATIALLFFVPILLFATPMLDFLTLKLKIAANIAWYTLLMTITLEAFLVWFFNVFIITDERIIDVDFLSLIYKNISSAKIDNIEDITVSTGGVLASLVNYGTVFIQTAGETPELQFEDVPQPAKVAKVLNELILEEELEKLEGRVK